LPDKQGIFPFISFQGLFRIRRNSPFFMSPRLPGKRQGRFHEPPLSVTQELFFPEKIPFVSRPDFSKYKTSATAAPMT
jgi:hypothetical protein